MYKLSLKICRTKNSTFVWHILCNRKLRCNIPVTKKHFARIALQRIRSKKLIFFHNHYAPWFKRKGFLFCQFSAGQ